MRLKSWLWLKSGWNADIVSTMKSWSCLIWDWNIVILMLFQLSKTISFQRYGFNVKTSSVYRLGYYQVAKFCVNTCDVRFSPSSQLHGMLYVYFLFRELTAERTDKRVLLMSEIIAGMRIVTMHCWEKFFHEMTALARRYTTFSIQYTDIYRSR